MPTVFLDWGGVLADPTKLASEWSVAEADVLKSWFGGSRQRWLEAHDKAFGWWMRNWAQKLYPPPSDSGSFRVEWQRVETEWMRRTLRMGGVVRKHTSEELFALDRRLVYEVARRTSIAFPFAKQVVQQISSRGYSIFLTPASDSDYVHGVLERSGLQRWVKGYFAPDIVDEYKGTVSYWRTVFRRSRARSRDSCVVDDRPLYISEASKLGAFTVLVNPLSQRREVDPALHAIIDSVKELPRLLKSKFGR